MTRPHPHVLGELIEPVLTWNPIRTPGKYFNYIDLGSVDQDAKSVGRATQIRTEEAPSRARQLVSAGDVLVSTVRPNLNGVAVVPNALDGATASTGFTVLRPGRRLSSRYLFHWVRSPGFIANMVRQATGASYPAISDKIVKASQIPLFPEGEQRRIAAILDHVDALRVSRSQAITQLDELSQAVFFEIFSAPDADKWPIVSVDEIVASQKGSIRTGPFGSQLLHSEFVNDGVAVLGIDNAVANVFQWGQRRYISEVKYSQLSRYRVYPGDVLITIMGTCGRCAVVPEDIPIAINTKHLCCITLDRDRCLPAFLHASFLQQPMARTYLQATAKGAIMAGLNMGIIRNMPLVLPPIAVQQSFAQRISELQAVKTRQQSMLVDLEALFGSLQSRAFSGVL
jgi:type I restriction enzyme S subunit